MVALTKKTTLNPLYTQSENCSDVFFWYKYIFNLSARCHSIVIENKTEGLLQLIDISSCV
jgi:hypothetical protein